MAGLLYLVNGATGFFSIICVPSRLIVSGNAAELSCCSGFFTDYSAG
jgi:hypothetical protein